MSHVRRAAGKGRLGVPLQEALGACKSRFIHAGRGEKMKRKRRAVEVLLVEDNPGDVRLMSEILKEGGVPHTLHVAVDGVDALAFLRR